MKLICRTWVEEPKTPSVCLPQGRKADPGASARKERRSAFFVRPAEGRLLHDTTDKAWEKPMSIHAAAEVKGNPPQSLKRRHRSQGAGSAPAKESTDFQGLQYPGFEQYGRASNSSPPNVSGEQKRSGRWHGSLQKVRRRH